MSHYCTEGLDYVHRNGITGETLEMILCGTGTTAAVDDGTGRDALTVSAVTLDEFDGTGYTAGFGSRPTLAGLAVVKDTTANASSMDGTDKTLTALGAGTKQIAGILWAVKKTSDATSIPLLWIDDGGFPLNGTGFDKLFSWATEGLARFIPPSV